MATLSADDLLKDRKARSLWHDSADRGPAFVEAASPVQTVQRAQTAYTRNFFSSYSCILGQPPVLEGFRFQTLRRSSSSLTRRPCERKKKNSDQVMRRPKLSLQPPVQFYLRSKVIESTWRSEDECNDDMLTPLVFFTCASKYASKADGWFRFGTSGRRRQCTLQQWYHRDRELGACDGDGPQLRRLGGTKKPRGRGVAGSGFETLH